MKFPSSQKWAAVCASILAMTAALKLSAHPANPAATVPQSGETYTGIITAINPQEHVLDVKNKKFSLGDACTYTIVGKDTGSLNDLRPGQQVTVSYHHITNALTANPARQEPKADVGGQRIQINSYYYANDVFVADNVQQELMTCDGTVRTNDLTHHTLLLRFIVLNKTFKIADDCQIVLSDGTTGTVTDIQSGNNVTVTYETPGGEAVAHRIAQTDATLVNGRVIEINQTNRTITTATVLNFHPKKFRLADNCTIAVNGKTNAQLSDIKIFDKLVFTYNNITGVNIVNYITTNIPTSTTNEPTSLLTETKSQQQKQKKQIQIIRSPRMQSVQ
jgi:hypothetical protein